MRTVDSFLQMGKCSHLLETTDCIKRRGLDLKLIGCGTSWEPEERVVHSVVSAEIAVLCVLVLRAKSIKVKGERDNHQPHSTQRLSKEPNTAFCNLCFTKRV